MATMMMRRANPVYAGGTVNAEDVFDEKDGNDEQRVVLVDGDPRVPVLEDVDDGFAMNV